MVKGQIEFNRGAQAPDMAGSGNASYRASAIFHTCRRLSSATLAMTHSWLGCMFHAMSEILAVCPACKKSSSAPETGRLLSRDV